MPARTPNATPSLTTEQLSAFEATWGSVYLSLSADGTVEAATGALPGADGPPSVGVRIDELIGGVPEVRALLDEAARSGRGHARLDASACACRLDVRIRPRDDGAPGFTVALRPDPTDGSARLDRPDAASSQSGRAETDRVIREREQTMRAVFDVLGEGIGVYGAGGELVDVNPEAERELGLTREQLVGRRPRGEFTYADGSPMAFDDAPINRVLRTGEPAERQLVGFRGPWPGGGLRLYETTVRPMLSEDGAVGGAVASYRNVTEHRRLAAEAERVARRFEALVTRSSNVISLLDRDGRWIDVTGALDRVVGLRPSDLIGRSPRDEIEPEDVWKFEQALVAVLAEPDGTATYEVRARRADGRIIWLEARLENHLDDPAISALVGASRDVTERHLAAAELELERDRFRQLADNIDEVFWTAVGDRTTYVNPAFERLWGRSADEMLADTAVLFEGIHEDDRAPFSAYFERLRRGERAEVEYRVVRPDGSIRWVWDQGIPIGVEDGEMRVTGIAVDVTERHLWAAEQAAATERYRELSESLRELSDRIEAARDDERQRIARELHDELGQTLTSIKLDLSWLLRRMPDEQTSERVRELIDVAEGSIETVRRLCNDLRPPILDVVGLGAAFEWQLRQLERQLGVPCTFDTDVESGPPVPEAVADETFRVFQEAVTNIARHADATSVAVSLYRSETLLTLVVEDDGKGLGERERGQGTLGLMGMRERALRVGGELTVGSRPGGGTRVELAVPLTPSAA